MKTAVDILQPQLVRMHSDYWKFLTRNGLDPLPETVPHYYTDHNNNRIHIGEQILIEIEK